MKKPQLLLIFYFLLAIAELASHWFTIPTLHMTSKPLLLIVLLLYLFISARGVQTKTIRFIQFGLVFSWIGDVLLMFVDHGQMYFIGGLAAFLITHIFYIIAFSLSADGEGSYIRKRPLAALPFVFIGVFLFYSLYPALGELKIPVLLYTIVITTMVVFALNRIEKVSAKSFRYVYYGAIIFMISDAVLAINKFLVPVENAQIIIMASYILAQFLIVEGVLQQGEKKNTNNAA